MDEPRRERFRDLKVWRLAVELARQVYSATSQLPADEKFGLVSQMRRAAVSVASNIAEGSVHKSRSQFAHFLTIALGSLAELETQVEISQSVHPNTDVAALGNSIYVIRRMLYRLRAAMLH